MDEYREPDFDYTPDKYAQNYPRNYPMTSYTMLEDGVIFTRDINDFLLREIVKRVIFTDFGPYPEGNRIVDLSLAQDRSILGWNQTIDDELCLVVSTCEKGKGIALNGATNYMFAGFFEVKSIEWNNVVTSENTISMRYMFDTCRVMEYLDLSWFDVRNTKYMNGLLSWCEQLKDVKLFPLWQTALVEDVSHMFSGCQSLKSIDISGFDTSSLKKCEGMFNQSCVRAVNLGQWYPTAPGVELNTRKMFAGTGLLSVLVTDNPKVQEEYLNMDESTKYCQDKNNIPRQILPASEWYIPTYSWDKPQKASQPVRSSKTAQEVPKRTSRKKSLKPTTDMDEEVKDALDSKVQSAIKHQRKKLWTSLFFFAIGSALSIWMNNGKFSILAAFVMYAATYYTVHFRRALQAEMEAHYGLATIVLALGTVFIALYLTIILIEKHTVLGIGTLLVFTVIPVIKGIVIPLKDVLQLKKGRRNYLAR